MRLCICGCCRQTRQKLFDDVERRQAPAPEPKRRAGDGELNDEKSKKSLSEIYEEAYLREKERQAAPGTDGAGPATASGATAPTAPTTTEAEDKEVKRIQGLMNELFRRLDQLTNFHYTPAEPTADVQVIANVPAIAVEEKVPASVSDAARLAPEEVYKKPTTIIAVRRAARVGACGDFCALGGSPLANVVVCRALRSVGRELRR